MSGKSLVPIQLPRLDSIPATNPAEGFYKLYLRDNKLRILDSAGNENIVGLGDITISQINNWNEAYSWGDHADAGYVTLNTAQVITAAKIFDSSVQAATFIKTGGSSLQFLKADGSVDNSTYLTTGDAASTYVSLAGNYNNPTWIASLDWSKLTGIPAITLNAVTTAGNTTANPIIVGGVTVATNLIHTDVGSGRVGIGTLTPGYKLDVAGDVRATSFIVTGGTSSQFLKADGTLDSNTYLTTGGASGAYVSLNGSYADPTWITALAWTKITGAPAFITGITSSDVVTALGFTPVTNARTITINGVTYDLSANRSWTISTATPTLDAVTTAGNTTGNTLIYTGTTEAIRPNVDSVGSLGASNFRWGIVYSRAISAVGNSLDVAGSNINLNDTSGNIKLKVFGGTGNVTIQNGGTHVDAGYRLDVIGNTRVNGGNTSADTPFIINNRFQFKGDGALLFGASSDRGRLTWDGSGAYFSGLSGYGVGLGANGTLNHLFINTSGNVGIGTTTPNQKLTVSGVIEAGSATATSGGVTLYQTYGSPNYLGSMSTEWGSGSMILGYGAVGKSGAAGFVSTFANFTGLRAAIRLGQGTVSIFSSLTAVNTAVGSDLTMTETIRITEAGRMGIGTTTPGHRLTVIDPSNTVAAFIGGGAGSPGGLGIGTVNSGARPFIQSYTAGAAAITDLSINPSGGNVGIGTTSPGVKLDVVGSAMRVQSSLTDASSKEFAFIQGHYTNAQASLNVISTVSNATQNIIWIGGGSASYNTATDIRFFTAATNTTLTGTERMRIASDGNVGIGTTTPDRLVHINSTVGNALRIDNVGGGQNAIFIGNVSSLIRWSNGSYFSNTGMYSVTSDQQYITFDGTNTQVRLQIKASNGNIGINTVVDAGYKLDVNGTARVTSNLLVDGSIGIGIATPSARYHQYQTQGIMARYDISSPNANQNRGVWDFYTNVATAADFFGRFGFKFEGGVSDSFKQFQLHIADSVTPKFVVDGAGRVGIGTIVPGAKLHVFGTDELLKFGDGTSGNNAFMSFNDRGYVGFNGSAGLNFIANSTRPIVFGTGSTFATYTEWARFATGTGNLLINTNTDAGYKLDVNGTARVQSQLQVDGNVTVTNVVQAFAVTADVVTADSIAKSGGTDSQFLKADGSVDETSYATSDLSIAYAIALG